MKKNNIFNARKMIFRLLVLSIFFTSCDDFLEESSPIGLSQSKLTDLPSMSALINGSYSNMRAFYAYQPMITSGFVRDYVIRNSANWTPYYKWTTSGVPEMFSSNTYSEGYKVLNKVNTVLNANVNDMYGTTAEKSKILGDAHFLRAAVYFQINNFFTDPSTGNSAPLVTTVLGTNDKVTVATSDAIKAQIEADIESAREHFAVANGVSTHTAATAMAARIYFYHGKYSLAYDRANEAINAGGHSLEANVADIYNKGATSAEAIYTIITNRSESTHGPQIIGYNNMQADKDEGTASLNPNSLIGQLRSADPTDSRFTDLFTEADGLVYADKKYPSLDADYIVLRLAEMYLTRAEANIMVNNAVSTQDVADVNMVKNRAGAADTVTGTPAVATMLDVIFNERSKELCFEYGDRFLNSRRLQKSIVDESGSGTVPYANYNTILVYPLPRSEVNIHNLQR
ncbi:MAG: RagB/SusD family nutrient uptake outer membrane protein [Bacteroidetes bacterium]|nr:RagB/SusD family nutrient uptake outer membrane protein [Bacteroidota bacterium]